MTYFILVSRISFWMIWAVCLTPLLSYSQSIKVETKSKVCYLKCIGVDSTNINASITILIKNVSTSGVYFRNFCRNVYDIKSARFKRNDCDIEYRNLEYNILNYKNDTSKMVKFVFMPFGEEVKGYKKEMKKASFPKIIFLKPRQSIEMELELRIAKDNFKLLNDTSYAFFEFNNINRFEPRIYPKERPQGWKEFRGEIKSDTFIIIKKKPTLSRP